MPPTYILDPPRFSDLPKSLLLSARGFPSSILSVSAEGHLKQEVLYIIAAVSKYVLHLIGA